MQIRAKMLLILISILTVQVAANDVVVLVTQARTAYSKKEYLQAERLYRQVLALAKDVAQYQFEYGMAQVALNRWTLAKSSLERSIALDGQHLLAHYNLGKIHLQLKKPLLAEAAYRRALEIDITFAPAIINLANLLVTLSQYPEAQMWYQELLGSEHHADACLGMLITAYYLGNKEQARQYLQQLRQASPEDTRIAHWQAQLEK
jgi:Tfp pilus assembly protein PilF